MTKFFVLMFTLILLFTVLITRMFFFCPFSKPSLIFTLREVRGQAGACVNFLFIIYYFTSPSYTLACCGRPPLLFPAYFQAYCSVQSPTVLECHRHPGLCA